MNKDSFIVSCEMEKKIKEKNKTKCIIATPEGKGEFSFERGLFLFAGKEIYEHNTWDDFFTELNKRIKNDWNEVYLEFS
jgi:hypothetical protein